MADKDLCSLINPVKALSITAIGSSTTTNGDIIDMLGYDSATFIIFSGAVTDGTYTPNIIEGDNSALSDGTSVTADYLIGTYAGAAINTANTHKKLGYVGKKRYIRLQIISTGVTTGGSIGADLVQGDAARDTIPWTGTSDNAPIA